MALLKFVSRVTAYLLLLRDEYPSTDEEQAVHIEIPYPDVPADLNRWLPLIKWLLAVPHYVALFFLGIGVLIAVVVAWFSILLTGRYPRGLFTYVVGVLRWATRVQGYMLLLVTGPVPSLPAWPVGPRAFGLLPSLPADGRVQAGPPTVRRRRLTQRGVGASVGRGRRGRDFRYKILKPMFRYLV